MSPIIDLQRRMVEAGRIRAGDTSNGHPRKLEHWRLTSKDRTRLEAAAELWGGKVREWDGRAGEFELYTETAELPIMLLPDTEPSLWYELWTRGGCQRRCDGMSESISDGPCLCDPDARECKPHLRFPVLLPDLRGIGCWLVQSTGWNAANEIPGSARLLSRASAQGVLVPARLRLEQRVDVKAGQTRRFAVPVIDVDVSFRELLGGQAAQPLGYTPVAALGAGDGISLEQGLAAAEGQQPVRTARSAAPIPSPDDGIPFGEAPVPVPDEPGAPFSPHAADEAASPKAPQAETLEDHLHALNALVGQLREAGEITTRQLWVRMARMRNLKVDEMIELLEGEQEGKLHWSPLRESLSFEEAAELRKRLAGLWLNVEGKA